MYYGFREFYVSRLQEQLQAERDLRAALEVGLSMPSGQFSNSRGMDSKTRAELEEIALAEADVARLKQKVAELHHQLNQQRQHHYGSLSDACDRYQNVQNHSSQQKFLQQDFDTTLAFCNHERKQRTERCSKMYLLANMHINTHGKTVSYKPQGSLISHSPRNISSWGLAPSGVPEITVEELLPSGRGGVGCLQLGGGGEWGGFQRRWKLCGCRGPRRVGGRPAAAVGGGGRVGLWRLQA
ncbi:Rho GTPase-activating protein 7 [Vitis vinifera]|uniref:Rho GTPase-activating protein 7 n=1 Tax=Vitis vinifera TaxID=29760 RepID=A0A438C2X1_VITVI|nr:Rho GTPase-activating protein 7 [Vitis vinifera]